MHKSVAAMILIDYLQDIRSHLQLESGDYCQIFVETSMFGGKISSGFISRLAMPCS